MGLKEKTKYTFSGTITRFNTEPGNNIANVSCSLLSDSLILEVVLEL